MPASCRQPIRPRPGDAAVPVGRNLDFLFAIQELTMAMNRFADRSVDPNGLVSIRRAARILRVHEPEVVRRIKNGTLPFVRRSKGILIPAAAVYKSIIEEAEGNRACREAEDQGERKTPQRTRTKPKPTTIVPARVLRLLED